MRLCSSVDGSLLFRNLLPLSSGQKNRSHSSTLKTKGSVIPCTLIPPFQSTQYCIGEGHNPNTVLFTGEESWLSEYVLIIYTCLIDFLTYITIHQLRNMKNLPSEISSVLTLTYKPNFWLFVLLSIRTPQTYVGTRASTRHVGTLGSCPAGPSLGLALVGRVTASFLLRWAVTGLGLHEVSFVFQ